MSASARPLGITVIAILAAIGGVFGIINGLGLMTGGGLLGALGVTVLGLPPVVYGVIVLVIGAAELYAAYGAWNLKGWAWMWLLVLQVIGILLSIYPRLNIVGIAIGAVVLFYLYTPQVKKAFGRS